MHFVEYNHFLANHYMNNLYVTDSLQFGGTPQQSLSAMNTQKNKYVMFDDKQTIWEFDADNTQTLNGSNFVGNGTFTAVFSLKLIKNENNHHLDANTQYILRVVDDSMDEIKHFMNIWNTDKQAYPKNIIDIFFYGSVIVNGNEIARYVMTRRYGDYHDIENLTVYGKQKYLYSVLQFLNLMHKDGIVYRDFKFQNIGYDGGNELIFIVLDYDDKTLLRKNSPFLLDCIATSKRVPSGFNVDKLNWSMHGCSGTYMPYYMSIEKQDKSNPKFDKIYSSALAMVLCFMFFDNPQTLDDFLYTQTDTLKKFIANPRRNGITEKNTAMQQYNEYVVSLVRSLNPNFSREEFDNANKCHHADLYDAFCVFLRVTIDNLVSLDYNQVMYPQTIINLLTGTLTTYCPESVDKNEMVNTFYGLSA